MHPDYGYPPQQAAGYVPPEPNAYSPPPGQNPYGAGNVGPRRADENVSAEKPFHSTPGSSTKAVDDPNTPLYDANGIPFYMSSGEGG